MGIGRILRHAVELRRHGGWTSAALERWRDWRWRRIARRAVGCSRAYRDLYRGLDLGRCRLEDLPPLRKVDLHERFDEFLAVPGLRRGDLERWLAESREPGGLYRGRYVPFLTSGTSGTRTVTVYDRPALDRYYAAAAVRRMPRPPPPPGARRRRGRPRVAAVLVTGGPYPTQVAARHFPRLAAGVVERRILSLRRPLPSLVEELNAFRPRHLTAYPSVLGALAREKLAGRLHLETHDPLRSLHAVSEPLLPGTVDVVRSAWDLPVQDTYGAGEALLMARSCCPAGVLHEMGDLCILQPVDERGRAVPDGTRGARLLVTNLVNEVQPLLRYEIDDVTGFAAEPCACGLPFRTLLPVAGRAHDVFWVDRPGGGYEPVHSTTLSSHAIDVDGVAEYQLVQVARNAFELRYTAWRGASPGDTLQRVLRGDLERAGLAGRVSLETRAVEALTRHEVSGKVRRIWSDVGPPADLETRGTAS